MQCEHAQAMTRAYAAEAVAEELKDRIAALEAIVKEDSEMTGAKAPEPIDGCSNGHEARYRYSIPGFGEIRCTMCDLKEAWTRTAMLEAIIESEEKFNEAYRASAEIIAARVIEVIESIRAKMSAEQMNADRVEIGAAQITYLGKADPFIAID